MTDPPPRFIVRNGVREGDFMIWDRERRGPAQINSRPMTCLTKEEALDLRDQLEMYFATSIGGDVQDK